jgi:hypothetical protein
VDGMEESVHEQRAQCLNWQKKLVQEHAYICYYAPRYWGELGMKEIGSDSPFWMKMVYAQYLNLGC